MGLFDELGSVLGDVLSGKPVDLQAVAGHVFDSAGGVNGIVAQLQQAGLGRQVASWSGTGNNLPVSADQIAAALSSDQLQGLAQRFGIDLNQLPQVLSQLLPQAIDKASPDGVLPS